MTQNLTITQELIDRYAFYLKEQERAGSTIQKYTHDLSALMEWLKGRAVTKGLLLEWKEHLEGTYAARSANAMLAALNGLLCFCGCGHLKVRPFKVQKSLFCDEKKELSREEYARLVRAAQGKTMSGWRW